MSTYVGRLAPSPTGAQHIGNARTYLVAWLAARSQGGKLILRIEDVDSPRTKPGADRLILEDFQWLGLDWDEGPYYQTQRLPLYKEALEHLQRKELVYPCTCSRKDIEQAACAPHLEHEGPAYPGTCAHRTIREATKLDQPFAWRFRSIPSMLKYFDGFRGPVTVAAEYNGDFVIWKADGTPAYQLAVVVDDAAMGVTDVIRGDDLIPSTPRQLQLYQSLELAPPRFTHVPLVVGPDGRRLAKRHGDTRLSALRGQGVQPEYLVGLLAWSCGWQDKIAPIRLLELLPLFRLETIPSQPFVLTPELLHHIG